MIIKDLAAILSKDANLMIYTVSTEVNPLYAGTFQNVGEHLQEMPIKKAVIYENNVMIDITH